MAELKQIRAVVHGRVQGVSYRAATVAEARALGLAGYARNQIDGSVVVVARGEDPVLRELLRFLHRGPSLARVTSVEVDWDDRTENLPDPFSIRY